MNCLSCGRQQDPSNRYCETCGTVMVADEASSDSRAMFEQPAAPETGYRSYPGSSGSSWTAPQPAHAHEEPRARCRWAATATVPPRAR